MVREVQFLSGEEETRLDALVRDIESLLPVKKWIAALIVGAFSVGAWATALQAKSIVHDSKFDENKVEITKVKKDLEDAKNAAQGTSNDVIEIKSDIKWIRRELENRRQ